MADLRPDSLERYNAIDQSIKARLSFSEWCWMSDEQKATLEQGETEPEY